MSRIAQTYPKRQLTFANFVEASGGSGELRLEAVSVDSRTLGDLPFRGFFQQFVDECLIGLVLLGGEAPELGEQSRVNADGDELLGAAGSRASDAAGALQFLVSGFGDVGKNNFPFGPLAHARGSDCLPAAR